VSTLKWQPEMRYTLHDSKIGRVGTVWCFTYGQWFARLSHQHSLKGYAGAQDSFATEAEARAQLLKWLQELRKERAARKRALTTPEAGK
jgi:hypothetical protein